MSVTVKIGVACDGDLGEPCTASATLDADLSAEGHVELPNHQQGWCITVESDYGQRSTVVRCPACDKRYTARLFR